MLDQHCWYNTLQLTLITFKNSCFQSWHLLEARHIAALDLVKQWTTLPLYKQHCKRSHRAPKIRKWCTVLERHICRVPCTTCAAYDLRPVHRAFCSRLSLQCSLTQVLHTSRLASWRIEMMIARIGRKEADQLRNLNMAAASCKRGLEVELWIDFGLWVGPRSPPPSQPLIEEKRKQESLMFSTWLALWSRIRDRHFGLGYGQILLREAPEICLRLLYWHIFFSPSMKSHDTKSMHEGKGV